MSDSEAFIRAVSLAGPKALGALQQARAAFVVLTNNPLHAELTIAYADDALAQLTGYSVESLRGMELNRLLERPLLHLSKGLEWRGVVTVRHLDGTVTAVDARVSPVLGGATECPSFVLTLDNSLGQRSLETCLEQLQSCLNALVSVMAVGAWVAELGDDRWLRLSPELMKICALTQEELERKPEAFFERIHPEDRARFRSLVRAGMVDRRGFEFQHRIVLPGGETRWMLTHGTLHSATARLPARMIGIVRDVTEQVAARNALTLAERRFAAVAEASRDGLLILQAVRDEVGRVMDFKVMDLNERAAELLGGRGGYLHGMTLQEFVPRERFESALAACVNVMATGRLFQETTPGRIHGLAAMWIHWRVAPLGDGVAVAASDVGWERELSKQVAQASRLESIGSLAIGIAHDFNNMLSAVVGFSDIARDSLPDDSQAYADLGHVLTAAERASRLTRYLLAFGKRQPLEPELVEVGPHLDELAPILARLAGSDVEVAMDHPNRLRIWVDPGQFEQVVVNLVVNARDAMPKGGTLSIRSSAVRVSDDGSPLARECVPGEYVCISFLDNGTGMDEQTRARIFEPFFTTKGSSGGTGLGLASAYGFVKQSGGAILVDSTKGNGTTFRVYFPRAQAARRTSVAPAQPPSSSRVRESATVLVVENDDLVRVVACRLLELHGHKVLKAATPGDAEKLINARRQPVDVLLVALRLPQASGLDVARRVKSLWPETKVLLMSGAADMHELEDAADQLNAIFVPKPLSAVSLAAKLDEALRTRTKRVEPKDNASE
jgi:PAS domain S-box-containing protein